jgi:hypothetical protein
MIVFEGIAVGIGGLLVVSHLIERIPVQRGVLLGIAAGLGFGISDVAIKALSGDLASGPIGLPAPGGSCSSVASCADVTGVGGEPRSHQAPRAGAGEVISGVAGQRSPSAARRATCGGERSRP